jgi:hypothetical protein
LTNRLLHYFRKKKKVANIPRGAVEVLGLRRVRVAAAGGEASHPSTQDMRGMEQQQTLE